MCIELKPIIFYSNIKHIIPQREKPVCKYLKNDILKGKHFIGTKNNRKLQLNVIARIFLLKVLLVRNFRLGVKYFSQFQQDLSYDSKFLYFSCINEYCNVEGKFSCKCLRE